MNILESIKLRPGMNNLPDTLLNDIIQDTTMDVRAFLNYEDAEILPMGVNTIIKDMVVIKCNHIGSEGISSESHEGISQTYEEEIPQAVKKKLYRYRKLRW